MKPFFLLFMSFGLVYPFQSSANELNFDALSEYTSNQTEINNFSNVIPTDWSFNAIKKLAENRDCNFIIRKSDLVSSRMSLTRHEAALIIRTCLKEVNKLSEVERRLLDEFRFELKSIKDLYNINEN